MPRPPHPPARVPRRRIATRRRGPCHQHGSPSPSGARHPRPAHMRARRPRNQPSSRQRSSGRQGCRACPSRSPDRRDCRSTARFPEPNGDVVHAVVVLVDSGVAAKRRGAWAGEAERVRPGRRGRGDACVGGQSAHGGALAGVVGGYECTGAPWRLAARVDGTSSSSGRLDGRAPADASGGVLGGAGELASAGHEIRVERGWRYPALSCERSAPPANFCVWMFT
jgi:hypothetical protein